MGMVAKLGPPIGGILLLDKDWDPFMDVSGKHTPSHPADDPWVADVCRHSSRSLHGFDPLSGWPSRAMHKAGHYETLFTQEACLG